jgi:hypothetical protein
MTGEAVKGTQATGAVRVVLPASVAFNLDLLKKSIAGLAEQLGCSTCFSGANCFFQMEREFVVEASRVVARDLGAASAFRPSDAAVNVALGGGVSHDLNKVLGAVERVVGILGCRACCSGFDVFFRNELRTIVVNDRLEAQHFGSAV